jgi:hypothetical protein
MVQACLVLKLGGLEEEGSGEAGGVTGVGSSGVLMGFGMRFVTRVKWGKILVGCPMVLHNAHGGGMWGGEGREGSLFLCVPHWFVAVPPVPEVVSCSGNISSNCVTGWVSGWMSH